jgi:DNA-binding CsgD family transcriptional regulator
MPRSRSETSKRILARIQRLCCLGVGSETLMPELMGEVAKLVPFQSGWFGWVGPNAEFTNLYTPNPITRSGRQYWTEYCDTPREKELIRTFREVLRGPMSAPVYHPFRHHLRVDLPSFLKSGYYNDICRPADICDPLGMVVQVQGRSRGLLYFWRAEGEPAFDSSDEKILESFVGFVAHALTPTAVRDDVFFDGDERALLIVDRNGMVQHAGQQAQYLLRMALMPSWSPTVSRNPSRNPSRPAPELALLCHSLVSAAKGELGQPPPVLRVRNPWGEFVLRAYWLEPTDGAEQTRHIGITIERRVPRGLAIRRRVEELPLTGREKQLCLLLAHDGSRRDLADSMGVSTGTVITHQSSIYAKLGVRNRTGLLATLLPQ